MGAGEMTARCMGCNRACEIPEKGSAVRVFDDPAGNEAEIFMELRTACPQCASKRVAVLLDFGFDLKFCIGPKKSG